MQFVDHIFKAYDIRGLIEGELSEELAYRLGHAFVHFLVHEQGAELEGMSVVVGRDMRETSVPFSQALMKGLNEAGANVVNIGLTSTCVFNFACAHYPNHVGGIMVTASHNPAEYNGFKMTMHNGLPIGKGSGMDSMKTLVQDAVFTKAETEGTITEHDVRPDYIKRIFGIVDTKSIEPLHLVIDGGNGMGDVTFPTWLKDIPVKVDYLYMEPDGSFPNHEANPLKVSTLKDLQAKVLEVGADFGFALDGDADRIGLVDEKGNVVGASEVAALIGKEVLKKHPKMHMLYDLRTSHMVKETWEREGATTDMCPVGHALIKATMHKDKALFASELSLHLYFGDMYSVESTDLCLLYILQLLSREKKPLSTVVEALNSPYSHSGEHNFEVEEKDEAIARLEEKYKEHATHVTVLDGLWMAFDWGWVSVRKSNTEPVLRLNLETKSQEMTDEKLEEFKGVILG
ncbi:phosphomannomutase/phosphoglucomutase [Patescibacteria group bacterium]|nr:phosphomannomutase/phosphoglucomutase [Patescibacteria group bacterium]MBU1721912.1 phosphomannomutase/phosphoglucomutase [Patescibacteria group bacterium]MBU1901205.1 phosphomannomutase/phosphoglucomutase [Patescibacteria group bacterium]